MEFPADLLPHLIDSVAINQSNDLEPGTEGQRRIHKEFKRIERIGIEKLLQATKTEVNRWHYFQFWLEKRKTDVLKEISKIEEEKELSCTEHQQELIQYIDSYITKAKIKQEALQIDKYFVNNSQKAADSSQETTVTKND